MKILATTQLAIPTTPDEYAVRFSHADRAGTTPAIRLTLQRMRGPYAIGPQSLVIDTLATEKSLPAPRVPASDPAVAAISSAIASAKDDYWTARGLALPPGATGYLAAFKLAECIGATSTHAAFLNFQPHKAEGVAAGAPMTENVADISAAGIDAPTTAVIQKVLAAIQAFITAKNLTYAETLP